MARPPIGHKAMTPAQRMRRHRRMKRAEPKRLRRAEREALLAESTARAAAPLGTRLYGVIYADPPWRFEPYSRETGMDRAAENHYPTMTLDAIKALPVPAAADCVLFLWAPLSMLPQALDVIAAWGFTYKSAHGWRKPHIGTGYWVRDNLELLLIATRGNPVAPAPGQQMPALIEAPRGRHSEKPDLFAEMIERLYPHTVKLEMFARKPRPGWHSWGNELDPDYQPVREAAK